MASAFLFLNAVAADAGGRIFELDGYRAVGMSGSIFLPLTVENSIPVPHGTEFMYLPDRYPVVFDPGSGRIRILKENPHAPGEPIYPVALFNSPGHMITALCAYRQRSGAKPLPLFSYGAAGWHRRGFRSAALCVDTEPRQDLRRMNPEAVARGIEALRKRLTKNRLVRHLEHCALVYGCPAGKNFFLGRYEAPLPTATRCNARCLGCISLQKKSDIPCSQERIAFTPSPREIAEVALHHIRRVKKAVVSFGQGCEGEPLTAARVIEPAIRKIRTETGGGTLNLNTNGSLPAVVKRLFAAGLDSIRISMNSVRKDCYHAYFRPKGYTFSDVMQTVETGIEMKKFISINYLNLPGFTDTPEEARALFRFLKTYPVHMIQWRNLNMDPLAYLKAMKRVAPLGTPMGVASLLDEVRKRFPRVRIGYFNPYIPPRNDR
ncbi:MAG: radical SAM protein [Deltaproteobacteria bacterium]|nr:radical SAM protein [Deltaproteobacteria bacterium]